MMQILCSPKGICDIERPGQGMRDMQNVDFQLLFLDLSMVCPAWILENFGKRNPCAHKAEKIVEKPQLLREQIGDFLAKAKESGLAMPVARAPYLSWDTKRTNLNNAMQQLAEESIKICGQAGCRYIIISSLFFGISDIWETNKQFFLGLVKTARENQVTILLENQCRNVNGHLMRGICSDAQTAAEWIDRLNSEAGEERFGFCLDTGVCNLCGQDMYEFTSALGTCLKAVILRDCDGHSEASLLPFTCVSNGSVQTDWLGLIRGLRKISFDGQLIMDFSDTAAGFSPLLRPQLISLAKSVADYFKWQIEIEAHLKKYSSIALFGAGNMCRNYMKCYGEKYPPLFTCDNNKSLWGTSFCGLEVKPPEALKSVPDGCGIFICNIYYREIETQLKEMGIKNIEHFNDEYMPMFYFDRLERDEE